MTHKTMFSPSLTFDRRFCFRFKRRVPCVSQTALSFCLRSKSIYMCQFGSSPFCRHDSVNPSSGRSSSAEKIFCPKHIHSRDSLCVRRKEGVVLLSVSHAKLMREPGVSGLVRHAVLKTRLPHRLSGSFFLFPNPVRS